MNGHEKRRISKMKIIIESAMTLFNKYGIKKVSIEEIAKEASVSKVTIYKYFESKENLYSEIVKKILENNIKQVEDIIDKDLNFFDKLKVIMAIKSQLNSELDPAFLEEVINYSVDMKSYIKDEYRIRTIDLMSKFFDIGKAEGYLDSSVDNEVLFLYTEIFQAGMKEKSNEVSSIIKDKESLNKLINLYFFGLIKKEH